MAKKKSKKNNSIKTMLPVIAWFLIALIIGISYLVNKNRIASNLKSTGFFNKIGRENPSFVENAQTLSQDDKNDVEPISTTTEISLFEQTNSSEQENTLTKTNSSQQTLQDQKEPEKTQVIPANQKTQELQNSAQTTTQQKQSQQAAQTKTEETKTPQPSTPAVQYMSLKLYFMSINANGSVTRKEVKRTMKKSDSPLVDAINALITGPTEQEQNNGCMTMISNGTRLIGASVKNSVATLNFSEEIEFNQLGIEGTRGQLQQIVYTATAFPTVESVQILVDGVKKELLGSEGVWIGTPLSRNSF